MTVDGQSFSLAEERGRVVLVTFWATWCAPCRAELPEMDAYYRIYHRNGFDMLAISLDEGVSKGRLAGIARNWSFPVARLVDMEIPLKSIPTSLPVTRVYDRNGLLRFDSSLDQSGRVNAALLEKVVSPLIAGAGVQP